jgi:hypothetical protein
LLLAIALCVARLDFVFDDRYSESRPRCPVTYDAIAENPTPEPVEHVTFQRELKSGKLSGLFTLTFVQQQSLETFLASVVDPVPRWPPI